MIKIQLQAKAFLLSTELKNNDKLSQRYDFFFVNIAPSKWRWTRSDHSCLATNETHKKNVRYENGLRMSQDWGLEFDQLSASVCIQKALSVSAGHIKRLKLAIWLTREDDRRLLAVDKNQFHNQAPIQIIHILSSQSFQCRKGTNNFFFNTSNYFEICFCSILRVWVQFIAGNGLITNCEIN